MSLYFKQTFAFAVVLSIANFSRADVASFQGLGDLLGGEFVSIPSDVSADGVTVVGSSASAAGDEAFIWTAANGMVGLGDLPGGSFESSATAVSADGSVVFGVGTTPDDLNEGFRWTAGTGMVSIGALNPEFPLSIATCVSDDGAIAAGSSIAMGGFEVIRWTQAESIVGIGELPGGAFGGMAWGISADGSTIVGSSQSASGGEGFRWTASEGMVPLADLPAGATDAQALAASGDGSFVVGYGTHFADREACLWLASTGIPMSLGDLPGGTVESVARDISPDGAIVVGSGTTDAGPTAVVWDRLNGMRSLQDVLSSQFGLDLTGWTLNVAYAISADGRTIVGSGINPNGDIEGWIASLPESLACKPHNLHVVDTFVDEDDGAGVGTGTSLREAIAEAVAGDVIVFDASLAGETILLTLGELVVSAPLTIDGDIDHDGGADITLDGNSADRILQLNAPGETLVIQHLVFQNGSASGSGGAVFVNNGSLEAYRCNFTGNTATGNGGAIQKDFTVPSGTVLVSACQFTGNAGASGGAIYNSITGTPNTVNLVIDGCTFESNQASSGGAVYQRNGDSGSIRFSITNSQFNGNRASTGGAIAFSEAVGTMERCRFFNNTGLGQSYGGAVHIFHDEGEIVFDRCVFQFNQSGNGFSDGGGAIYAEFLGANGTLRFGQSVFLANQSYEAGNALNLTGDPNARVTLEYCTLLHQVFTSGSTNARGWHIYTNGVGVELHHSLVGTYVAFDYPYSRSIVGGFTSGGYNVFSEVTVPEAIANDTTSAIMDTGTAGVIPGSMSDAIDAGDPTLVSGVNGVPLTDIEGKMRIAGAAIDPGTHEFGGTPVAGPAVASITRLDPEQTNAGCVRFLVTFDQPVEHVLLDDMQATATAGLLGVFVSDVSRRNASEYVVTVDTGSGSGTIGLDVRDDDSIVGLATRVPMGGIGVDNGGYTGVEAYQIPARPIVTLGDMNCDNLVNLNDVPLFVEALTTPATFSGCDIDRGDINQDSLVDGRDVQEMVRVLINP